MDRRRLTIQIAGREALPVRAIAYVTGWNLAPDEVARNLAMRAGEPFEVLRGVTAFHLHDGNIVKVLPKEWDAIVASIAGFEARLRNDFRDSDQGYAAWRKKVSLELPAGVFVWLDEFETSARRDFSECRLTYIDERPGERELNYSPMMTADVKDMVLAGFDPTRPTEMEPIDLDVRYRQQADERRKAGRYSLEEAASAIEKNAGERADAVLKKLMRSVRDGTLPVFEPGKTALYESDVVREFYEEADGKDLNTWLARHEPRIHWRFPPAPAESLSADDRVFTSRDVAEASGAFIETVCNGELIKWSYWVHKMPTLNAPQAARLMAGLDPDKFEDLSARPTGTDPERYCARARDMQRLAEAETMGPTSPRAWLGWADGWGLPVHPAFRIEIESSGRATDDKGDTASALSRLAEDDPKTRRANHDLTRERGCRRLILENWEAIEQLHGVTADGRQVLRVLKRKVDPSTKTPELKTVQNHLIALRKERLIP